MSSIHTTIRGAKEARDNRFASEFAETITDYLAAKREMAASKLEMNLRERRWREVSDCLDSLRELEE